MNLQSLLHIGNISLQTGVLYFYMWNGLIWYVVSKYSNMGSYYLNCVYENSLVSIAQEGLGRHRKLTCCVPHVECPLKDSPQYFLDIKLQFFSAANVFVNVVYDILTILFWSQCVKLGSIPSDHDIDSPQYFFYIEFWFFFSRKYICKRCLWYLDIILVTMCQIGQHSILPWWWVRSIITFFVSLFSGGFFLAKFAQKTFLKMGKNRKICK